MASRFRLVLAAGFGTVLALMAGLGVAGFIAARTTQNQIVAVHEAYTRHTQKLREVAAAFFYAGIDLRDALLVPNEETEKRFYHSKERTQHWLAELPPSPELQAELDAYWTAADRLLKEREPATLVELALRREAVLRVGRQIDAAFRTALEADNQRIEQIRITNRRVFISILTFILLLGIAIAVLTWRRLGDLERQTLAHEEELMRLSRSLLHAQENERRLIARELHDELGQQITGMGMLLATLQRLRLESDRFNTVLDDARRLNVQTLKSVRTLALGLRPSLLDDLGLQPALQWFTREFSSRSGIPVDLQFEGPVDRIPEPHRTSLYRAVQEALTNAARHSRASRIDLNLTVDGKGASLTLTDNGVGFDPKKSTAQGLGLVGISERVAELQGQFIIDSIPGRGARLSVRVPLPEEGVPA